MFKVFICLYLSLFSFFSWSLSFDQAFKRIESTYPAFEQIELSRNSAQSLALPEYYAWLPNLNAEVNQYDAKTSYSSFSRSRSVGLSSQWTLFSGGYNIAQYQLASLGRKSALISYEKSYISLESEVANVLLKNIYQKEKAEIALARIENKEKSLSIAKKMYKRGKIPRSEFDKLSIELSNAKAFYEDSKLSEIESQENLLVYLGEDNLEIKWPWIEKLKIASSQIKNKIVNETILDNVDYKSSDLSLKTQSPLLTQARSAWMPSLSLMSTYGRAFDRYKALGDENYWSLSLTLSIPLFQRLSAWGAYRSQVFQKAAVMKQFEITKRTVKKELNYTRKELQISSNSALARDKILVQSRKLFEKSLNLFKVGRITVNALATDEERWLTSRELAVDGWLRAHSAYLSYCHVRGKRLEACNGI